GSGECFRCVQFGDGAVIVDDGGERRQPEVDPAGRCVGGHRTPVVDVGAVDLDLQRHPPSPGLLLNGCPDDPGAAVRGPLGEPGHTEQIHDFWMLITIFAAIAILSTTMATSWAVSGWNRCVSAWPGK